MNVCFNHSRYGQSYGADYICIGGIGVVIDDISGVRFKEPQILSAIGVLIELHSLTFGSFCSNLSILSYVRRVGVLICENFIQFLFIDSELHPENADASEFEILLFDAAGFQRRRPTVQIVRILGLSNDRV